MKLAFIACLVFIACNNKAEKTNTDKDSVSDKGTEVIDQPVDRSLVGRWRPVAVDVASMEESEKKNLMENAIIEFTSDGQMSTTMKETVRQGTYMYSEQEQKLMTKLGDDDENFYISWDKDLLKMKNEDGVVTLKRE